MLARRQPLNDLQHGILDTLGRVNYATAGQFAHWHQVSVSAISRVLAKLIDAGLVRCEDNSSPSIWRLSFRGASVIRTPLPAGRRYPSWSVMAHGCHRNATEIALQSRFPEFGFLSRLALMKQGFNPAHGEHAGVDTRGTSTFVLLDDYLMQPERIAHSWGRRHTPNRKYWPDPAGRVWGEVMQRFIIVSTDPLHLNNHREFLAEHPLPADLLYVEALWR